MRFLRGLSGRVLTCGCLVGVYETYDGVVVATIDARGQACPDAEHRLHAVVPVDSLDDHELVPAGQHTNVR
jgi:hypothetical protein